MKILIVEDNEDSRIILKKTLESVGHTVEAATNGKEALKIARESPPDMIISDILMPVMDGFRFCKEVKGDDELKAIPFVFYTATYTDSRDEELALGLGADRFIVKPVEPDKFKKIIQGVIRDVKEGKIKAKKPALKEDKEVFKLYSERLVKKLEKKMLNLESEITEHKKAEEKIKHLNLVLYTIRRVNQLIVKINEPQVLIQSICHALVENRGYHNAWIVLIDEKKEFIVAETGLNKNFSPIVDLLKSGVLLHCGQSVLERPGVQMVEDPRATCSKCPLSHKYGGRSAMRIRLEYDGNVYGLLTASISKELAKNKEEHDLFEELAGDIGLALHAIGLEKKERQTQEAMRESEEKYRLVSENAYDAIFIVQDEVVKFPNPKAQELSGYSAEELAKVPFISLVHPEDKDMVFDRYMRWMKEGELPETYAFRIINKAGEKLWVQLNTTAVSWNKRPATLNILRDITSQKKLEAQFLQAQKMEAIGTLTGGVAHDFNNLLTVILGNAELSLVGLGKDNPVREKIEEIKKAGKSAASLTRQLLAFSRKQVLQSVVSNLNTVIKNLEKMLIAGTGPWRGGCRPRTDRAGDYKPGDQRRRCHVRGRQSHH